MADPKPFVTGVAGRGAGKAILRGWGGSTGGVIVGSSEEAEVYKRANPGKKVMVAGVSGGVDVPPPPDPTRGQAG